MSWQAYIDTQLVASGAIHQAAMLGLADGSVWASTPDFCARNSVLPFLAPRSWPQTRRALICTAGGRRAAQPLSRPPPVRNSG